VIFGRRLLGVEELGDILGLAPAREFGIFGGGLGQRAKGSRGVLLSKQELAEGLVGHEDVPVLGVGMNRVLVAPPCGYVSYMFYIVMERIAPPLIAKAILTAPGWARLGISDPSSTLREDAA